MTAADLYQPIVVATIINALLIASAWRGFQAELRTGTGPWWLGLGTASYVGLGTLLVCLRGGHPIADGFDLFEAAMVGEAIAALVAYGFIYAVALSRERVWSGRVRPMLASMSMAGLALTAVFTA